MPTSGAKYLDTIRAFSLGGNIEHAIVGYRTYLEWLTSKSGQFNANNIYALRKDTGELEKVRHEGFVIYNKGKYSKLVNHAQFTRINGTGKTPTNYARGWRYS
jgi:hypothetical protein